MNAELMKDLEESGDGLLPFAETLRSAPQARVSPAFAERVMARVRTSLLLARWLRPMPIAAAASVAAMLAIAAFMDRPMSLETRLVECQREDGSFSGSSAARYVQAFAVSALACAEHPDFTALGIAELSADELSREAKDALAKLGASRDDGLVFSVRGASRL